MVNTVPAIIVGGPPHMGKSVLFYNLARTLRERGVQHHAIRACPDGEGNFSQEIEQARAQEIRRKGAWSQDFIDQISNDIEQRVLPMLVDVGGRPQQEQDVIFQKCTHAILLLPKDESATSFWLHVVEQNGLLLLAQLYSELNGISILDVKVPVIRGTISGLERGTRIDGEIFDAIVDRIATLFRSYETTDLESELLYRAPTEIVVELKKSLETIAPGATEWKPEMTVSLLERLPVHTPLSVYGHGPQWLYAALAAHTGAQPFYQFDPRLGEQGGWIAPPKLQLDSTASPFITVVERALDDATVLDIEIRTRHLDYIQSNGLGFTPVPSLKGVILYGSTPAWLVTALVKLYMLSGSGVAWIGRYAVNLNGVVVVYSQVPTHKPGDLLPFIL